MTRYEPGLGHAARALIRRLRNSARALLRPSDPFRNLFREGTGAWPPYHGQYGQDRIFHEELFGNRKQGVFVDVGAHDGVSLSNTLFLERDLGWRGLCVEPIPEIFANLERNRSSICIRACVARTAGPKEFWRVSGYAEMLSGIADSYDPRHIQRIRREIEEAGGGMETIKVEAIRIDKLFRDYRINSVDLLCIDVEGAEIEVLTSFDFAKVLPAVVCIENNYLDPQIWRVLRRAGYRPYARIQQDEIYLARGFTPTPLA